MDHPYDEAKFTEFVLYVAKRLEGDPAAGAVKLNKVLHFAECAAVRALGHPITGAEYQRLQLGPAPRRLKPVRRRLVDSGEARVVEESYLGYTQQRLLPLREPDLSAFGADELEIIDQVLAEFAGWSGTAISDLSHQDLGWQMVDEGETIPFEAAFLRPPVLTEAVRAHGLELARNRTH